MVECKTFPEVGDGMVYRSLIRPGGEIRGAVFKVFTDGRLQYFRIRVSSSNYEAAPVGIELTWSWDPVTMRRLRNASD